MPKDFFMLVDVSDKSLAKYASDTALELETSGRLVVVEAHPPLRALRDGHPFSVAVFDAGSRSREEIMILSDAKNAAGLPMVSIHVGVADDSETRAKIMGVSRELFEECLLQLLAFCYITCLVRGVISDARKMI